MKTIFLIAVLAVVAVIAFKSEDERVKDVVTMTKEKVEKAIAEINKTSTIERGPGQPDKNLGAPPKPENTGIVSERPQILPAVPPVKTGPIKPPDTKSPINKPAVQTAKSAETVKTVTNIKKTEDTQTEAKQRPTTQDWPAGLLGNPKVIKPNGKPSAVGKSNQSSKPSPGSSVTHSEELRERTALNYENAIRMLETP